MQNGDKRRNPTTGRWEMYWDGQWYPSFAPPGQGSELNPNIYPGGFTRGSSKPGDPFSGYGQPARPSRGFQEHKTDAEKHSGGGWKSTALDILKVVLPGLGGMFGGLAAGKAANKATEAQTTEWEAARAEREARRAETAKLRDRLNYMLETRLGMPETEFVPHDIFNPSYGSGPAQMGGIDRKAYNELIAKYQPGMGGIYKAPSMPGSAPGMPGGASDREEFAPGWFRSTSDPDMLDNGQGTQVHYSAFGITPEEWARRSGELGYLSRRPGESSYTPWTPPTGGR